MVNIQPTTWHSECGCITVYVADTDLPSSQRAITYTSTVYKCATHNKLSGSSLFSTLTKEIRAKNYFLQDAVDTLPDKLADISIDENGNEVRSLKKGIEYQYEFIDDGNDNSNRQLKVKFVPTMKFTAEEAKKRGIKTRSVKQATEFLDQLRLNSDEIEKLKKIADEKYNHVGLEIKRE